MKRKRKLEEMVFRAIMYLSMAAVILPLAGIFLTVCLKGIPSFSWEMLSQTSTGGFFLGKSGGILNAIIGSLFISAGASAAAFVLSFIIVFYLHIYARPHGRLCGFIRFTMDVLTGIPSIVYGAFGFTIMLLLGIRASLLGGIITVTVLIFPIMVRGIDEVFSAAPAEIKEASYSLGATRFETGRKVLFRQGIPGIITSVLIAFGRAIGDAASVIFTAGFSDRIPTSLSDPAATLPLTIFFQLSSPIAEVRAKAYTAALILTIIILLISITARILSARFSRNIVR